MEKRCTDGRGRRVLVGKCVCWAGEGRDERDAEVFEVRGRPERRIDE